jgi:hypothetical protein
MELCLCAAADPHSVHWFNFIPFVDVVMSPQMKNLLKVIAERKQMLADLSIISILLQMIKETRKTVHYCSSHVSHNRILCIVLLQNTV